MLSNTVHLKRQTQAVLVIFILFLLFGCDVPSEQRVSQDFKELFSEQNKAGIHVSINSVDPGEGDSGNTYMHVKFDVFADEDIVIKDGILSGISLSKGQRLYDGEVIMLYQDKGGPQWELTYYELQHKPTLKK